MSRVCRRCGGTDFYVRKVAACVACRQAYQLRYYAEDPTRRVINACQARLRHAHTELGLVPPKNVFGLLGCSKQELLRHLEERFEPGMTWGSFGAWQMDHRVPISAFPQDADGLALAAYYKNLLPVWTQEHKQKTREERKAVSQTACFLTRNPPPSPDSPNG